MRSFKTASFTGATLALMFSLSACGPTENEKLKVENEDLRSQVTQLEAKVTKVETAAEEVKSNAEELKTASDDLQSELSRFNSDNWRDVVPDATSAGDEVEAKSTALESSISDLDDATSE